MMMSASRGSRAAFAALVLCAVAGCVNVFWHVVPRRVDVRAPLVTDSVYGDQNVATGQAFIRTPVKAHVADGSIVVFAAGAWIDSTTISGDGISYLNDVGEPRRVIPLDSVIGVETFEQRALAGQSLVVSTAATAVGTVATVGLLKLIFGSCPTVYSDTSVTASAVAEGFSYAIAPLLEQPDLDPLRV